MCGFFTRCPKIYDEYSVSYQNRCAFWWPLWCRVSHHRVSSKPGGPPAERSGCTYEAQAPPPYPTIWYHIQLRETTKQPRGAGTTPPLHNLVSDSTHTPLPYYVLPHNYPHSVSQKPQPPSPLTRPSWYLRSVPGSRLLVFTFSSSRNPAQKPQPRSPVAAFSWYLRSVGSTGGGIYVQYSPSSRSKLPSPQSCRCPGYAGRTGRRTAPLVDAGAFEALEHGLGSSEPRNLVPPSRSSSGPSWRAARPRAGRAGATARCR